MRGGRVLLPVLLGRAVQPGQLIGACCAEHVALAADQFGEYGIFEVQGGSNLARIRSAVR